MCQCFIDNKVAGKTNETVGNHLYKTIGSDPHKSKQALVTMPSVLLHVTPHF
jgi:hypothetical protein